MNTPNQAPCPRCGKPGTGRFCPSCGAQRSSANCRKCGADLAAGARFCSGCGVSQTGDDRTGASYTQATGGRSWQWTPWRITGILTVVALIAVTWAATRRPPVQPGPDAPVGLAGAAPDLSNLTPREQFTRLADRVESSVQAGDTATVVRFFPMVEGAFSNLPASDRDADARFHLSLLRAQVGHFPGAIAEIDTIVAGAPTHLFADYLRAIMADLQGDTAAAHRARLAFRTHFEAEISARRPEYAAHRGLLDAFLKLAPAK